MHWFSLLEVNRAGNVLVCLDTQRPTRMRLICDNWLVDWSKQTRPLWFWLWVLVIVVAAWIWPWTATVLRCYLHLRRRLTTCEVKKKELPCRAG
jgi:hypothetical protein